MSEAAPAPSNDQASEEDLAKQVAGMPDYVKELYADYLLALKDDEGAPVDEKRIGRLRHAVRNSVHVETLKREMTKLGEKIP